MVTINRLRDRIDQTDDDILSALAGRHGLDPDLAKEVLQLVIRRSREAQARRLQEKANPLKARVARVSYQGTEGAYSWVAAQKRYAGGAETQGFASVREAMDAVQKGIVDQALLPVENTLAGSLHEVYDLLDKSRLHVVGEEVLRIEHCLIGLEPIPLERIKRVVSHPMALQQCTRLLRGLPGAECQAYIDTAEAVAKVKSDGDPLQVAIASRQAAEHHGLTVLKEGAADQRENYTRFWIIDKTPIRVDQRVPARTSLLLVTDHRDGALVHCLQALAAYGINMTKLESRPLKETPWHYSFYLDLEGNLGEDRMTQALDSMRERSRVLRVLGCYPKAQDLYSLTPLGAPAVLTEKGPPPKEIPLPAAPAGSQPGNGSATTNSATPANLHTRIRRGKETVVEVGGVPVGGGNGFVVMAGPCAVESKEQIRASAALVKEQGGVILRGGAYKPRTSPYSFQGLGAEGVSLLTEAGRLYGLPVVSEVLAPEQVEEMARKVDLLQVGARNMQNYPLLRELGRCHQPVLLKRGMSATIEELLNAAEYILSGGNQQVILCERGIRTFEKAMRSTLDLGAVVVLKERTHLPVIVDPSHAAGKRAWVPPLARAARAVGCDGIIVEVHPEPDKAKSDKDQALTPEQFAEMMAAMAL